MKLLKNKADFLGPHAIQLCRRDFRDILPVKPDFTGARAVKTTDQIYESALARSRRTHDCQPLPGLYRKRNIVKRANYTAKLFGLGRIQFADIFQLDQFTPPSGC